MKICYLCGKKSVKNLINFGKQPVSHKFLNSEDEEEYFGMVILGQCQECSLVQQLDPMPVSELRPRYEWLTRSEPERHLDDLVQTLIKLPGITKDSKIWGVCWKEDTTLDRFNKLGFSNTHRLTLEEDLGIKESLSDVETVQERFTFEQSEKIVQKRGKADIVMARHLIEHAFNVQEFLKAIKNLLNSNGYLILEIPDCERSMEYLDYTTVWEEHILYFTPEVFKKTFAYGGFKLIDFIKEEYPLENSYIGIAQIDENIKLAPMDSVILIEEIERAEHFASQWKKGSKELKEYLINFQKENGKIAIFGAAHMSCAFVNLLGLEGCIDFVVDDNPYKKNMFMPGSKLPILPSRSLMEEDVKLCLLTLSVTSEEKVLASNQEYIEKGGVFKSIFPANAQALNIG